MDLPVLKSIKDRYDALILDLDGTVLDSMRLWYEVDRKFLARFGYKVTSEYTEFVKSASIEEGAEYTVANYDIPLTASEVVDTWNDMVYTEYANSVRLKEGSYEYIRAAKQLGFKIACATALASVNARAALDANHVTQFIDILITLEDIEGTVNKTEPDIYLKASEELNVPASRCLVFEDVPAAIQGARKGGFGICAVYDDIGCKEGRQWQEMIKSSDYALEDWRTLI
ncbi:haloacid dehalogenase superfamily, subfamily IA, variant 3 with third motif having DD or ED [Oscillospiraceae bacterium]|nr:haloacid dehalogenase superfamily, subfamily IA, variant 3 with third motif having DD or ED [Oscillospiraceae bacterium]